MSADIKIDLGSLSGLADRIKRNVGAAIDESGAGIEGQAKADAPKRTGAMANSTQYRRTGEMQGEVTVGVEYGVFVELGTVHQAAQPFLTPAAEDERPRLVKRVQEAVNDAADRR
jgi:HK97 gp10 family phage protein